LAGQIIAMKTLQVELPDQMAHDITDAVETGKFENAAEVVRAALRDFVSRRRFELLEQQQLKDVAWALNDKPAK
jgi:putative addiction module CopG family antidote